MLEKLKYSSVDFERELDLEDVINVKGMLSSNKNFQSKIIVYRGFQA